MNELKEGTWIYVWQLECRYHLLVPGKMNIGLLNATRGIYYTSSTIRYAKDERIYVKTQWSLRDKVRYSSRPND